LAFISGSKGVKLILLQQLDSFQRQISIPQIYNRHPKRMITKLFAMQWTMGGVGASPHLGPTTSNYLDL